MPETTRTYSVPGISCDHCKQAIESAVAAVEGVDTVTVDVADRTVAVDGGSDDAVVEAIIAAGYDVD